jgi:hypothetical protein
MASDDFQREIPRPAGNPQPGWPGQRDPDIRQDDGGGVNIVIPYRNPAALIAYYCSVFSLVPCLALLLGPIALILGIVGLRVVSRNPSARGTVHAWIGIVLGFLTFAGNLAIVLFLLGTENRRAVFMEMMR